MKKPPKIQWIVMFVGKTATFATMDCLAVWNTKAAAQRCVNEKSTPSDYKVVKYIRAD